VEKQKEVESLVKVMKSLGIYHLGNFLRLPKESLGSRFGKTAVQIHHFAIGSAQPPWKGFYPSSLIEESMQLDDEGMDGVEVTLEPLLFALKSLIDRAMTRLIGLGQRASKVQIELQMAQWSTIETPKRTWEISLPVAQGTSTGLIPIIREHLAFQFSNHPLLAPARSLKFTILTTIPGHGAQRDFFHSKELEAESWDQLLGRLLTQLGPNYVFRAELIERHCPEKTWTRTVPAASLNAKKLSLFGSDRNQSLREFESANRKPQVDRPSRILSMPEPLLLKPSVLIHPSKTWKLRHWEGPERISTEWWKSSSSEKVNRDYYRVTTLDHEKLWIFFDRNSNPPQAYLHGFFD
jgi:protein ImuB